MRMSEQNHHLMLTDQDVPDGRLAIAAGLLEYNQKKAGYVDARELSVFVIDTNTNQIVGGLVGRTSLGLFFVDLIFLPEMLRRSGLGSEIMERAEAEARRRGCSTAVLYTITFQAPGFYERRGYRVLGRIECKPPGHTRLCMTKTL
jgi:GNAT superfamily N-acetyltransferase